MLTRHLLPARQVASLVTARQQHFGNGLCAGPAGLVAQLAARMAAGLQLMGTRLQALQSQIAEGRQDGTICSNAHSHAKLISRYRQLVGGRHHMQANALRLLLHLKSVW